MKIAREFLLNDAQRINNFIARGEITIDGNRLSYNFHNGVASFRFISRYDINVVVIRALNKKWICFDEYRNHEYGHFDSEVDISQGFTAFLEYGYTNGYEICFYVKSIISKIRNDSPIFKVEVFSPCLLEHFFAPNSFDYNTNGFIDNEVCAEFDIDEIHIKVYKSTAIHFNHNQQSMKIKFPKEIVGGFVFEANKSISDDLVVRIVNAVNRYCEFLLCDAGNFINYVNLANDNNFLIENIFFIQDTKSIVTESIFNFDTIKSVFSNIMKMFLIDNFDLKELYYSKSNTCEPLDILRCASMFENQYRENLKAGIEDYCVKEQDYKVAYKRVIHYSDGETELEKAIIKSEKDRVDKILSSLRSRLKFVFAKMLKCLDKTKAQISSSFGTKYTGYDMTNLANRITDARNDIAHLLKNNIDYHTVMLDTLILQKMIYFMIFERAGLPQIQLKQVVLSNSRRLKQLFDIKGD